METNKLKSGELIRSYLEYGQKITQILEETTVFEVLRNDARLHFALCYDELEDASNWKDAYKPEDTGELLKNLRFAHDALLSGIKDCAYSPSLQVREDAAKVYDSIRFNLIRWYNSSGSGIMSKISTLKYYLSRPETEEKIASIGMTTRLENLREAIAAYQDLWYENDELRMDYQTSSKPSEVRRMMQHTIAQLIDFTRKLAKESKDPKCELLYLQLNNCRKEFYAEQKKKKLEKPKTKSVLKVITTK